MFGIGQQELIIFLIIVLIIFGPKNLPKLASSMGKAIRDFKSSLGGVDQEIQDAVDEVKAPPPTQEKIQPAASISTSESPQPVAEEKKAD